eukprot:CAMPEP_0178426662 /NCGR_PEP_ID=MMETSP0689_2-20121128/29348_1 /TAXON_ID=160604 /ORGANISM="Amphidinium massartii, Strain CS-259" /LENGTH=169 /DNA_ID=CAMNT_0020048351 /DNA_START=267 /DNA_END=777 /DNA_ORIENTATION=-
MEQLTGGKLETTSSVTWRVGLQAESRWDASACSSGRSNEDLGSSRALCIVTAAADRPSVGLKMLCITDSDNPLLCMCGARLTRSNGADMSNEPANCDDCHSAAEAAVALAAGFACEIKDKAAKCAPADWPAKKICAGSPPKRSTFLNTHRMAASTSKSISPTLPSGKFL